jgi:hypothetical protein
MQQHLFDQHIEHTARESELMRVVQLALRIGGRAMRAYAHDNSPKVFTQPQLLACLILKCYLGTTYRGVIDQLSLMPAVREALGLRRLPHFTALQKFASRKDVPAIADRCLAHIVRKLDPAVIRDAAIDSTGVETTCASVHYTARSGRKRSRFVKLSMVVLCGLFLPVAMVVDWGPSHDLKQGYRLAAKARGLITPGILWGDSAFDSEEWHEYCWDDWGVISYAPTVVRSRDGSIGGDRRWLMKDKWTGYGARWDIETAHSAMKRRLGSDLTARTPRTLRHEAAIKALTYAIIV